MSNSHQTTINNQSPINNQVVNPNIHGNLIFHEQGQAQRDQERRDILHWLSPLNFWTRQIDTLSRRQDGTGQWIFEEPAFQEWLKGTEKILWCPGMPGAGKTVLASVVIAYLQDTFRETDIGISFLYCNYKEKEAQTTVNLVACLLQQLVDRRPAIPSKLRLLYEQSTCRRTRPVLAEYSELLHTELATCSRAFIVVDALDECEEVNGARRDLIFQLQRLPPNTSVMITSRALPSIEDELSRSRRLEIRASDRDVRTYLEGRIEHESRLKRHLRADSTLRSTILDTIVAKVDGMFLLAQLHMESLVKRLTPNAVRIALNNLPKELDDTYEEAMERIYNQGDDEVQLAVNLLSWIIYSLRPLTVKELQHAMAIKLDNNPMDEGDLINETELISVCAGIVTIDQESSVIRLVHYTTEEYFQRKRVEIFPSAQTSIATTCLKYLSLDALDAFNVSYSSDHDRIEKHALLRYAAQHWGHHAAGETENAIQSQILEFITQHSKLIGSVQAAGHPFLPYYWYSPSEPQDALGLWVAVGFGLIGTVRILIMRNVGLNVETSHMGKALYVAAENGHEAVARLLVEKGAAVDAENEGGWTAMHAAAKNGHEAVVRLLVEKGAEVNTENFWESTALHDAAKNGYEAVARLLVEKGAEVNTEDYSGSTALHDAAKNGYEAVARLLVEKGAEVDVEDEDRRTALHLAARAGHEAVARLLVEKGAAVEAEDEGGWTALHAAAEIGHEAVVRLLVEKGAEVDAGGQWGLTALHLAVTRGHEAVARLLVEKGAEVEARDQDGLAALHMEVTEAHEDTARLLVEKGAEVNAGDEEGGRRCKKRQRMG